MHFASPLILAPDTSLGSVAQRILKMMTLPQIASKPCMLKAFEMLPAATVSNTLIDVLVLSLLQKSSRPLNE